MSTYVPKGMPPMLPLSVETASHPSVIKRMQRYTDADTIADLRRQVEDAEIAAAELRQRYEPTEETP